jgi:L-alanine-DL-glutamate epimerase-like enolase superfamily enzyme
MVSSIESVSAVSFSLPFARTFQNATSRLESIDHVWVEVSAQGQTGRGEVTVFPGYSSETTVSILEAVHGYMGPAITGRDLFAEDEIASVIEKVLPRNPFARSAIDLALVELRARLLGVPAVDLFGGIRRREVDFLASVSLAGVQDMVASACSSVEAGATALQVKISGTAAQSVERVRAVREAVGPAIRIAIDGNCSFSRLEAHRTLDLVAPFDIALWEQPLPIWETAGMASLVKRNVIPIFADESLATSRDALRLSETGSCHGFTIKISKSGIHEARKIKAIAEAAGLSCVAGGMLETNWGTHAGIQFAATLPDPYFPSGFTGPLLIRDHMTGPPPPKGSTAYSWSLPQGPGWGIQSTLRTGN